MFEQQLDDRVAGRGVEVAGRFVGEEQRRIVGQRARNRDALLLAAGELRRVMVRAVGQAHLGEQAKSRAAAASRAPAISIGTRTFS